MSMRDSIFSVTSAEPIRAAVASGNAELVRTLVAEREAGYTKDELEDECVQQDIEAWRSLVEGLLTCAKPPKTEPGSWSVVLEDLARHLELAPRFDLPFNEGWKHIYCWKMYRKLVDRLVTRPARKSLQHLDVGRPLRGKRLDYDGCQFAWLHAAEVKELGDSLSQFDSAVIAGTDLVDFHETLIESLRTVSAEGRDLILSAC